MSSARDDAERAAALVDDPSNYETFAADYSDEVSFYSALRGAAQRSLTFAEYVELRRIFLARGPTDAIRDRLEERLDRSLKNMVLGTSPRGRAYAVTTLHELNDRRLAFTTLDIDIPSLLSVVQTTIEHLYDDVETPATTRETLAELLTAVPAEERRAVAYVARAWLTECVLTDDKPDARLESALSTYTETVPTPNPPGDGQPAEEYHAAAQQYSFADPKKEQLSESALHASPSVGRLCEYLYLTATNDIEAYRHGQSDVTRADFLLARRQLRLLQTISQYSKAGRVDAYLHLAQAIEAGGGRWLTTRARKPQPAWETVAEEYARAAAAIRPVDAVRFVKYLSKAFRHAAHTVDSWGTRYQLHINARRLFERVDPGTLATGQDRAVDTVESAIRGTLHTHRCREYEAQAHLAFATPAYEKLHRAAEQARTAAEQAPQEHMQLRELDTISEIASARQAERAGNFDAAIARYDEISTRDDELQVGISCHRQLCELKRAVTRDNHQQALATAHDWFAPKSVIVAAVEASCGLVPETTTEAATVSDQFLSVDTDALSSLVPLIDLTTTGGAVTALVREQIADCLVAV
jgi:hypothetical protein